MSERDDRARTQGWEAHRRAEVESALKTTPAERLRWLEQAIEFAFRAGALPRRSHDQRHGPG
jgi:hypothetical protein